MCGRSYPCEEVYVGGARFVSLSGRRVGGAIHVSGNTWEELDTFPSQEEEWEELDVEWEEQDMYSPVRKKSGRSYTCEWEYVRGARYVSQSGRRVGGA